MSFESILESIVGDCGGGLSVALMGSDGIPIAQVQEVHGAANPLGDDLSVAGKVIGCGRACRTGADPALEGHDEHGGRQRT